MSKNTNFTGNLIKEARENYKYTTEECAEKLGFLLDICKNRK